MQFLESYSPPVVSADREMEFAALSEELVDKRVVFVGERHDHYDHHLNQLAVLRLMHQQDPNLSIGVEWFQQPFQHVLDDYLSGELDEAELLKQSGYYERWRYDFRLLRPIMEYAKTHNLPIVALNAPMEITRKVSAEGMGALSKEERQQIPQTIHPPQDGYRKYLKAVFDDHMGGTGDFDSFVLIQRIWDETMAANIVRHLQAHPKQRMIVFAGSGHVAKDTAIPTDVARSLPELPLATLHSAARDELEPETFDYFILSEELSLPPTGRLGVWLEDHTDGDIYVAVRKLAEESAAGEAGMLSGDRFIKVDGEIVQSTADILFVLAGTRRGEKVDVEFSRFEDEANSAEPVIMRKTVTLQ
ncbi:MAG: ChaN family lipoprotein [Thiolinea sp.]